MRCPICGCETDDDDYWYSDKCLRCALKQELEAGQELIEELKWDEKARRTQQARFYGTIVDAHDWERKDNG